MHSNYVTTYITINMKKIKKYDIYISKLYLYIVIYSHLLSMYIAEMFFFLLWGQHILSDDVDFLISNQKQINQ